MCFAIPGKIVEIGENKFVIDYNGEKRSAEISVIDDLKIGDYVIVNQKIIIDKVSDLKAKEYLKIINELGNQNTD